MNDQPNDERKDLSPEDLDGAVSLQAKLALDDRARGFLGAISAMAHVVQPLQLILMALSKAEQRFLLQIAAWRMEGAPNLPATEGVAQFPLLNGMGHDQIDTVANSLAELGIIEIIETTNRHGKKTGYAFRWPTFEELYRQGAEAAAGPKIVVADASQIK